MGNIFFFVLTQKLFLFQFVSNLKFSKAEICKIISTKKTGLDAHLKFYIQNSFNDKMARAKEA
jgi:hypothetical protein